MPLSSLFVGSENFNKKVFMETIGSAFSSTLSSLLPYYDISSRTTTYHEIEQ